jgi:hypothetical protein
MSEAEAIAHAMLKDENHDEAFKQAVLARVREADRLVRKCGGYIRSRQAIAAIIVSVEVFHSYTPMEYELPPRQMPLEPLDEMPPD